MSHNNKPSITIVYCLAGDKKHWDNLNKALKSIRERIEYPNKKILVISDKEVTSNDGLNIIHKKYQHKLVDKNGNIGNHLFWRMKYNLLDYEEVDTDYVMYCDTDTVFVNDNIEEIINRVGDGFGICEHFWIPTVMDYLLKVANREDHQYLLKKYKEMGLSDVLQPVIAGGVFLFKNNNTNKCIIEKVKENFNIAYKSVDNSEPFFKGLCDEILLSIALGIYKNTQFLNGALNHCCEPPMDVIYKDEIFYGKNPQDLGFEKVTLFHCDTYRRIPGCTYPDKNIRQKCKELFYLS